MKISIITPVLNQCTFLEETILSVLSQDYKDFEYIIVDGGSTDGTLEIIRKYEKSLTKWVSEADNGMYDALNKGFSLTTGEIMCWINADDILLPGALKAMNKVFTDLEEVAWVQGLNGFIDLNGNLTELKPARKFSKIKFLLNRYKWIQQESTFWRRSLWVAAGGYVNSRYRFAGDFELWFRFFQHKKLYNVNLPIGAWRERKGQLSDTHMTAYLQEVQSILNAYDLRKGEKKYIERINRYTAIYLLLRALKVFNTGYIEKKRDDCFDVGNLDIQYSNKKNKFIIK